MRKQVSALGLILVSAACTGSAACTTTHVEYDCMTGTAFPQAQTVSGATVTVLRQNAIGRPSWLNRRFDPREDRHGSGSGTFRLGPG